MDLHEYQAKTVFKEFHIPTIEYTLCRSTKEVHAAASQYACPVMVKAQVHSGGRGKAGGIKYAKDEQEAEDHSKQIFDLDIKGHIVKKVIVTPAVNIDEEFYFAFTLDRTSKQVICIVSKQGGIDIEQVAKEKPEDILTFTVDTFLGIQNFKALEIAQTLFPEPTHQKKMIEIIKNAYLAFVHYDCSLLEINPLATTSEKELLALDAKVSIDDNAMYRHQKLEAFRDLTPQETLEQNAKEKGLSYVELDGSIGCMVNGAGLAMATMDVISHFGGKAANFLDIGGSSNPQKVIDAMNFLLDNPKVKVIMINIFGGITRCDDVAKGLVEAIDQLKPNRPIVIRLAGTRSKEGLEILKQKNLQTVASMNEAAKVAIAQSKLYQ